MSETCSSCQSARIEEAQLMGAGLAPTRASTLRKALAAAEVRVRVCLDCGLILGLHANVETMKKMLGED